MLERDSPLSSPLATQAASRALYVPRRGRCQYPLVPLAYAMPAELTSQHAKLGLGLTAVPFPAATKPVFLIQTEDSEPKAVCGFPKEILSRMWHAQLPELEKGRTCRQLYFAEL
jgi:molybdopterin-biosynthesis enzyme MoeA-like protein